MTWRYKYGREKILCKTTIILILLILTIIQISGCNNRVESNGARLTIEEEKYLKELSTFKDNNKDVMRKYMAIYIKHINSKIPQKDIDFIKEHTDGDYFDNVVRYSFLDESLIDYDIEGRDKDAEKISTGGYISVPLDYELPEESGMNIMRFYYFFKSNTYASKVSDMYGYKKVIYFKVERGKVVNIYEI